MNYFIYSDGSDFKKTNHRLGIGAVLIQEDKNGLGKKVDELSQEISLDYVKTVYGTSDCSNPTMEMLAVLESLKSFSRHISINDSVVIYADYLGVSKWLNKEWKINKPYIQRIFYEINEIVRKCYPNIQFRWCRGHQKATTRDSYWNNEADKLAKGNGNKSNFGWD